MRFTTYVNVPKDEPEVLRPGTSKNSGSDDDVLFRLSGSARKKKKVRLV